MEAELEASLEQKEKTVRDLKQSTNQLQYENESLQVSWEGVVFVGVNIFACVICAQKRIASIQADYTKLEAKFTAVTDEKDRLKAYTRELEQINDDLERAERVVTESMTGFQGMLNQAVEKNALLELEVEEKEALQVQVQRQLDVIRGRIYCYFFSRVTLFIYCYRSETRCQHSNFTTVVSGRIHTTK